jgi:hypothetical protein
MSAWRTCYLNAILETKPEVKFIRICEAFAAMEQRRLSPIETDRERSELTRADEAIQELISECGRNSRDDSSRVSLPNHPSRELATK